MLGPEGPDDFRKKLVGLLHIASDNAQIQLDIPEGIFDQPIQIGIPAAVIIQGELEAVFLQGLQLFCEL